MRSQRKLTSLFRFNFGPDQHDMFLQHQRGGFGIMLAQRVQNWLVARADLDVIRVMPWVRLNNKALKLV